MTPRAQTILFLVAWVLIAVVWDCIALARGGYPATISCVVRDFASANPMLAVAIGCLIGHLLWWQMAPTSPPSPPGG